MTPSCRCAWAEAIAACSGDLMIPVRLTTPRSAFTEISEPAIPGSERMPALMRAVITESVTASRGTLRDTGAFTLAGAACAGRFAVAVVFGAGLAGADAVSSVIRWDAASEASVMAAMSAAGAVVFMKISRRGAGARPFSHNPWQVGG